MLLTLVYFIAVFKWAKDLGSMLNRPDALITDELRILTVTWNIAGKRPSPKDIAALLFPQDVHHDLYVVGSQEALSSIMGSIFKPNKEAMN